ncbi:hypothetical protein [Staphylococcus succinus]|uniref:DUF2483 domain-containing protein n=1 Tax=Staphylococcus succinus TaxID=61015 RepID=A0ABX5IM68_9STAP|nr:hypothetical protein [Staphylococcus succinus]PTI68903.1 hypothetical protein BU057_07080 [Staphylococcus succinus]RIN40421.1 hypothetical protein BU061_01225 [Staphylococcus succinus]
MKNHRLEKIIKLPETTFFGIGMTTSIFIFVSGVPQNGQSIFACNIENDGLVTVKNQGRQDVYNRWAEIEDEWVEVIRRQTGDDSIQWLDPNNHLSWQEPEPIFELHEKDFMKTLLDFKMFEENIDPKKLHNHVVETIFYDSTIEQNQNGIKITVENVTEVDDNED